MVQYGRGNGVETGMSQGTGRTPMIAIYLYIPTYLPYAQETPPLAP
jgi:hypothetical protein